MMVRLYGVPFTSVPEVAIFFYFKIVPKISTNVILLALLLSMLVSGITELLAAHQKQETPVCGECLVTKRSLQSLGLDTQQNRIRMQKQTVCDFSTNPSESPNICTEKKVSSEMSFIDKVVHDLVSKR